MLCGGGELVARAAQLRPDLKILLTSGFTQHPAMKAAPLGRIGAFIAKPYRPSELAARIRTMLAA